MKTLIYLLTLAFLSSLTAMADLVVTKDGSRINGRILGIEDGKLKIATSFAGEIEIPKEQIDQFSTEEEIFLSFESGESYRGVVSGSSGGDLVVKTDDGDLSTTLAQVAESWQPSATSPAERRRQAAMKELERRWAYEASVDLTGKSGNTESFGLAGSFTAELEGPHDKLRFFVSTNFEETDEVKAADEAMGSVEYEHNFSPNWNWYVRTALGRDAIKDIDLISNTAGGFGYIVSDTERRELTIRGGVGYRYEAYETRDDLSSASLDFGIFHEEALSWGTLVNRVTYTPALDDFGNYRLIQDSSLTLPLEMEGWRIRIGLRNAFDSEVDASLEELDTTYYVRMVLNWE